VDASNSMKKPAITLQITSIILSSDRKHEANYIITIHHENGTTKISGTAELGAEIHFPKEDVEISLSPVDSGSERSV